jgi:uncharacterized membrane protein
MATTGSLIKLGFACLSFFLAVYWSFLSGPSPKTTVNASLLWMSPPIISLVIAITLSFILAHGKGGKENCQDNHKNHRINIISSSTAGAAIIMVTLQTYVTLVQGLLSNLKPYDADSEDFDASRIAWGLIILSCGLAFLFLIFFAFLATRAPHACIKQCKEECGDRDLETPQWRNGWGLMVMMRED